ncbi:large subunit ribosomal protein L10 [Ruminococcus sp. YE71]|uniref:50S ribosomal protein L10 n=1 Tax=unclassified Ruminococcus TaxID=2608920 RepID=UPI00087F5F9F|nr:MULTISPECIES: 50S ribosomal protein L10 [unclassified Ruminococcus]SDA11722.1 large subunit ribosomal protein L10 [Ruminococcus sp. YE78]SFW15665.1 large subunit ribosomal protein L10 [Ruminococcus sp. YE71]
MASEKVLATKKEKVAKLTEIIKAAKSGALVNYEGITVEQDTKLRKEMRENNINYFVEKNTMLRLAFKEAGIEGLDEVLNGTTAIAISNDDETAPARILGKFSEDMGDDSKFALKAGFIGTTVYDQAGVVALSKIPGKETLLAQLVGSLQGPLTKLAATIKAVADKKAEEGAA